MTVDTLLYGAKQRRGGTQLSRWSAVSRLVLAIARWFGIHSAYPERNVSKPPSIVCKVSDKNSDQQHDIAHTPIGRDTANADGSNTLRHGIGAPIKWNKPDRSSASKGKVKAEPVKAEPTTAEPVKAEPTTAEPVKAEPVKAEPVKAEPVKAELTTADKHDDGEVLQGLTSSVGMKKLIKIMKILGLQFSHKHNAMYELVDFCLLLLAAYDGEGRIYSIDGQYMKSKKVKGLKMPSRTWMYNVIKTVRYDYMLKRCMAMIRSSISQARQHRLLRGLLIIAIDMHDIPIYAKNMKSDYLITSRSKNGTTTFMRVISIFCVINGERFTLGAMVMHKDDKTSDVVKKMLNACRSQGLRIAYVLMDRGFHSADVLNALDELGLQYLLPAVKTGYTKAENKKTGKASGVKEAILEHHYGKRDAISTYTLAKSNGNSTASYTLVIIKLKKKPKKTKTKEPKSDDPEARIIEQYRVFATTLPESRYEGDPAKLAKMYTKRWGVENSYKSYKQLRLRTTSTNYSVRFLLCLMPFVLCNMWVLISNLFTRQMNYDKYTQCLLGIFVSRLLDAAIAFRDGPHGRPPS